MRRIGDWILLLVLFAVACFALRADPLECGKKVEGQPGSDLVYFQAVCIDYDELRRIAPGGPWPEGKVMQVFVYGRPEAEIARLVIDGERYEITLNPAGMAYTLNGSGESRVGAVVLPGFIHDLADIWVGR